MRFSVLLPTRNGGEFLANCIRSILEQDFRDFELVISDNANTDATPEILRQFSADPRVKVLRHDSPLSVSDNWSAAYSAGSGEYVLMMGDDDYLLPHALARLQEALVRHSDPDCLLYNGYSYVAPDSISGNAVSYWAPQHHTYGPDFGREALLDREHRLSIVRDMFRFQQRIPLNMQTTLFSRRAAERVRGGIFPPPFPDHYMLNALLISADRWVYLPERLVIVGVSPKSFGHFFYSQERKAGLDYLGISTQYERGLPGNELLNGMCMWLTRLKGNYSEELAGIDIDRFSYVIRQAYHWLLQYRYGGIDLRELGSRLRMLSPKDWKHVLGAAFHSESWRRLLRMAGGPSQAETLWHGLAPLDGSKNIREFAMWLNR